MPISSEASNIGLDKVTKIVYNVKYMVLERSETIPYGSTHQVMWKRGTSHLR